MTASRSTAASSRAVCSGVRGQSSFTTWATCCSGMDRDSVIRGWGMSRAFITGPVRIQAKPAVAHSAMESAFSDLRKRSRNTARDRTKANRPLLRSRHIKKAKITTPVRLALGWAPMD